MNNTGFYQNNENKRLKKLHLSIDSKQRDKKIYPNPNNYVIKLNNNTRLKYINSIRVIEAMIPHNEPIIPSETYWLDVLYNSNENPILLPLKGEFTGGTSLATHPGDALATYLHLNLKVTEITFHYEPKTNVISISNNTDNDITFLFETGTNAKCGIQHLIGANIEDFTVNKNELPKPLPNQINLHPTPYVDLDIDEIPNISKKLMINKDLNVYRFKRFEMDVQYGENQFYKSSEHYPYNYFTPMELKSFTIKIYDSYGRIYQTPNSNNYFTFELTMLADDSPDNISFFPPNPKADIQIENKEINIKQETDITYFDLDNKEVKENFKPSFEGLKEENKETSIEQLESRVPEIKETVITNEPETQNEVQEAIITNEPETQNDPIKMIEEYVKENKLTIMGISTFIIIFLIIFIRTRK